MRRIDCLVDYADYLLIAQRAKKQSTTVSVEVRQLIKNGLLFDVPERKSQIAMACAIESLLILRKLTERLADKELVKAANQEAQKMVDAVLLKGEHR